MRCPICKKEYSDDEAHRPPTYPFCSERCKLIDLGRWLGDKYQLSVQPDEASLPAPQDFPKDLDDEDSRP